MACRTERVSTRNDDLRAARDWSEDDHRNVMATIDRSEALRREQASAYRDAMRYGGQGSKAAEEALRVGRMLDASAMSMLAKFEEIVKRSGAPVQLEGGAAGLASGGVVIHADGGAVSPLDGGAFGEEPRRSGRESKAPKDETSWKSASWADTVQKMHAVRVHSGEAQRTEVTNDELFVVMRTLITNDAEDLMRLKELNILDEETEEEAVYLRRISLKSWKEASSSYKEPKSVKDALNRSPGEAQAWMEAITGELDWFKENGKVDLLNKRTHRVHESEIPPYKWNAEKLVNLRLIDLSRVDGLTQKQARAKANGGGKIDECFDVLSWTWDFLFEKCLLC